MQGFTVVVFGILVAYSDDYFENSLHEFNSILRMLSLKHKLIVVFNSNTLASKYDLLPVENSDFDFVLGTNQMHEFSGWSEGLEFVKDKYNNLFNNSSYIFANDTLCHHRKFTYFHRLIFTIASYLALSAKKPKIAGEIYSNGNHFIYDNVKFDCWISSYFFAINNHAMHLIEFNILPQKELINHYLLGGHDERYFFSEALDKCLKTHILNNLFHGGWYKSQPLDESNKDFFYGKARSILAEFSLSSKAHSNKIEFVDTHFLNKLFHKWIPVKIKNLVILLAVGSTNRL